MLLSRVFCQSTRRIGLATVATGGLLYFQSTNSTGGLEESKVAFNPKEWRSFTVEKVVGLNHNTKIFRVSLPSPNHEMGMSVASCIMVQGVGRDGKTVARPYTPISTNDAKGFFELMVKDYPDGNVSSYLHKLKVGDQVKVKGPFPKIPYKANQWKRLGIVVGGTGITPAIQGSPYAWWQVLHEIFKNPEDTTEVSLVFTNQSEDDILLKEWLDEMARRHHNFKVFYIVDKPSPRWRQGKGYINLDIIEKKLPAPEKDTMIFVCGPPGFMKAVSGDKNKDYTQGPLTGLLKARGFDESMVYKF